MGRTLHQQFAQSRFIYVAYAYRGDRQHVRIVRFRETGDAVADRKVIIEDIPAARFHAGLTMTEASRPTTRL
jgi:glucose/arabinose dehydrogenase